jgi:hypothetical protein
MVEKKYPFRRVLPFLFLLMIVSCTEVPDSDLELQPTELKVRILDVNYQQVTNTLARVYLYRDYVSFLTKTGAVTMSYVGKDGFARFTNLDPYNYFIYAVHEIDNKVYDNSTSSFNLFDYLTENAVTTISVKTNLAWQGSPASVEINSIDIIPLNRNANWVGVDYDTLWTEFMIIKDYDNTENISQQNVVAKANTYFLKNVKFGEFRYLYPVNGNFETTELLISNLEPYYDDDDPLKSNYVIYATFFTKKVDFLNRGQIYAENQSPIGFYEYEFFSLSDDLIHVTTRENPYPQLLFLDQTYYQKNNYLIFTKLTWK